MSLDSLEGSRNGGCSFALFVMALALALSQDVSAQNKIEKKYEIVGSSGFVQVPSNSAELKAVLGSKFEEPKEVNPENFKHFSESQNPHFNELQKADVNIYKYFFEWMAKKYGIDINELFQGGLKSEFYDFLFSRIPESNDLHLFSQNELLAEGLKLSANEGNFMTEEQASLVSSLLPFFDDKGNLVLGDREKLYSSKLNDIFPGYEIDLKKVHLLSDGTICFSLKDGTLCVDKFGKWFVFSPREAVYNGLFVPLYESFDKFLAELSEMSALDFLGNCNVIKSVFGNNMGRDDREDLVRLFGGNYDRSRLLRLLLNGEIKVIMLDHVCVGIGSAGYFYDKPTRSDILGALDLYSDVFAGDEHWKNCDGVKSKVLDDPSDYMKNELGGEESVGVGSNDSVYKFESDVTISGVPVSAPASK